MNEFCTCGAALPPGAGFCPKCGRPTGTLPAVEPDPPPPGASSGSSETDKFEINNVEHIRAAVFPAGLAAFLASIPFAAFLCFVWYPLAGFLTVFGLRRRTGATPPPAKGAGLGALTGLLSFVISLIIQALSLLLAGQDEIMEVLKQQAGQFGGGEEIAKLLENPALLAAALIFGLAVQCVVSVGFCAVGGALAAKVLEDDN